MFNTASAIDLPFGISKIKLIHQHISKQRGSEDTLPVTIGENTFQPGIKIRWLSYWFIPDLQSIYHYEVRLRKAKAAYGIAKQLASAGKGITPKSTRVLAIRLILPILTYGAQYWTPIKIALTKMQHL